MEPMLSRPSQTGQGQPSHNSIVSKIIKSSLWFSVPCSGITEPLEGSLGGLSPLGGQWGSAMVQLSPHTPGLHLPLIPTDVCCVSHPHCHWRLCTTIISSCWCWQPHSTLPGSVASVRRHLHSSRSCPPFPQCCCCVSSRMLISLTSPSFESKDSWRTLDHISPSSSPASVPGYHPGQQCPQAQGEAGVSVWGSSEASECQAWRFRGHRETHTGPGPASTEWSKGGRHSSEGTRSSEIRPAETQVQGPAFFLMFSSYIPFPTTSPAQSVYLGIH